MYIERKRKEGTKEVISNDRKKRIEATSRRIEEGVKVERPKKKLEGERSHT